MSDIKLTFILLNGICFLTFLFGGRLLSRAKNEQEYFRNGFLLILIYAIVHGLRFGRDIDWNLYYLRYKSIGESLNNEDYEPLFSFICHSLYNLEVPYHVFIFLQCAFLMFTILVLLRNYRKYIVFIIPPLLMLIEANDNFIRWYLALSFFFLSLDAYFHKKWKYVALWMLVACMIHVGAILFMPFLIAMNMLDKWLFPPRFAVILLVLSTFAVSLTSLSFLTQISNLLLSSGIVGNNMRVESYLMHTEDIINGDFGRIGYMDRLLSTNIKMLLSFVPAIWFAPKYIKQLCYGHFVYNLFLFGAIAHPLFSTVEIFNRYSQILIFFSCIVCGAYFYYSWQNRFRLPKIYFAIALISFLASIWSGLSLLWRYESDLDMMFIWNSGNRNYLTW